MSNIPKKKILVPIFNRAHYGRLRSVLKAIENHPKLELQIMTAIPAAYNHLWLNFKHSQPLSWAKSLPWYIRARFLSLTSTFRFDRVAKDDFLIKTIIQDNYQIASRVPLFFDGGLPETMAKSVGLGLTYIVGELKKLKPDLIFINADRFEMMAVALAAAYLNIPIAHNEAGDISGTIDESIRHAITKLAHLHFTSTETSRKRVIQMGENPDLVFTVGSPAIDVIKNLDINPNLTQIKDFDLKKPYLLVMLHPVATEAPAINEQMASNLVSVIRELNVPTIFLGSNIDAMSDQIGRTIKALRADKPKSIFLAKTLPPDDFYRVLANATCAIGNSSSFIREGAYFGIPTVLIGSRQFNRERGVNVLEVGIMPDEIKQAIAKQLKVGRFKSELMFGTGQASQQIADLLATTNPTIQKKFHEIHN